MIYLWKITCLVLHLFSYYLSIYSLLGKWLAALPSRDSGEGPERGVCLGLEASLIFTTPPPTLRWSDARVRFNMQEATVIGRLGYNGRPNHRRGSCRRPSLRAKAPSRM